MELLLNAAYYVAIFSSLGLFLFSYFEALKIADEEGMVRGGNMISAFSFALFFALLASRLS